ncbi:hypothetical protein AK36_2465 [Burkholderia vietnamiensis LMG 10929]|nr:hypothetical protein AK36_2465 [Burkholderia vietnamiensis LMG 10929]
MKRQMSFAEAEGTGKKQRWPRKFGQSDKWFGRGQSQR